MRIEQMRPDLYLAVGDAYDSNSTIFLSRGEALLIDAMGSQEDAENLKRFVHEELNAVVKFIVCTHYFSDHLAALKLFPESLILAHKNYRHTFDSELYRTEKEKSFFVEASILISDQVTIRWGDLHLDIFANPGHTMSTLNVDIPEADLVHVGDNLVSNIVYISYSTPQMFFNALEQIRRRGRRNLISSHGFKRSAEAVDYALYYLQFIEKKGRELSGESESITEIDLDMCLPEDVKGTPFEAIFHKRNMRFLAERKPFV